MPARSASTPTNARQRRRYAPRLPPEQRREQLIDAALSVILEEGYEGISIEAVARAAGVTRPVVYDHFPNLGRLLETLIAREERVSLKQLRDVVPEPPYRADAVAALAGGIRQFLEAVRSRPTTWRLILLPPEGTPATVRDHVEANRARILKRIEQLIRWSVEQGKLPPELDVELAARAIQDLAEEAGRMLLNDPDRYTAERYSRFVESITQLIGLHGGG